MSRYRKPSVVVAVVLLLGVLGFLLTGPFADQNSLPSPNGYEALMTACDLLVPIQSVEGMSEDELEANVTRNEAALEAARKAFQMESKVPLDFAQPDIGAHMQQLADFKTLARAFQAEGRLSEMNGEFNTAAASYLAVFSVAQTATRGGPMIDRLVGMACDSMGIHFVKSLIDQDRLSKEAYWQVLSVLDAVNRDSDTIDQVLRQEKDWVRRTFSPMRRLQGFILSLMPNSPVKKPRTMFTQKANLHTRKLRSFLIEVAANIYELDNGHHPENTGALVPKYLQSVPINPITEKPMKLAN